MQQEYINPQKEKYNELIQILWAQNIRLGDLFIFNNKTILPLVNLRGVSVFNRSQIEFIRDLDAVFHDNFNQWIIEL